MQKGQLITNDEIKLLPTEVSKDKIRYFRDECICCVTKTNKKSE